MSTGTCLQDSWIQIIQVDIERVREIITQLQSGFISFFGRYPQDQAVGIYAILERSRAEFYGYAIRPRHSRTEIERIKKAPRLYDFRERQDN